MRARHRLSKLLLRHGIVYSGGDAWTGKHDVWLRRSAALQRSPATRLTFDSDYDAVLAVKARRDRLDAAIEADGRRLEFTPVVRRLGCLRGVRTLTGFALAVEIGDWHRFTGNTIGSFVGLVPSEYSSGLPGPGLDHQDRQQPRPPAAGRGRLAPPRPLPGRQDHARPLGLAPPAARARGGAGQPAAAPPLGQVHRPPQAPTVANVAIARELAGWCWSLAVLDGVDRPRSASSPSAGWWQRVERPATLL